MAFYLMCFVFPVSLVANMLKEHLPIGQFLVNQVATFFVIWFVGYFLAEFYRDMLARANKPRDQDEDRNSKPSDPDANVDDKDSTKK